MLDKIKQLMEIKKQAEQLKRELEAVDVEVNDVPGIKIVITGTQKFKSIAIDEELVKGADKARIESGILRSMNAAIKASQDVVARKMQGATGMNIPGL